MTRDWTDSTLVHKQCHRCHYEHKIANNRNHCLACDQDLEPSDHVWYMTYYYENERES